MIFCLLFWRERAELIPPLQRQNLRSNSVAPLFCKGRFCCKLILAWWYVHVSDLPSSPLRLCIRSFCFVRAVIHALRCSSFLCLDAFLHALHPFMYHFHSWVVLTHVLHLFMHRSCVTLIHVSHSFMRCTYSCVTFVHAHVVSLFSRISHAAGSLLDLFFSLTCIKSQTSWPECSATIKTSARADVHKIHCWLTQLLFSFSSHSLNLCLHQSIFVSSTSIET